VTIFARVFERGFMTVEDFDVFLRTRSYRERWQLIGGQPIMMAPPTLAHQRIAMNFATLVNAGLARVRPDLFAYATVGVRRVDSPSYSPEPDVAVIPAKATFDYYATEFHAVMEIRSESNTADHVRRKLAFYTASPTTLYVLVAEQRAPEIDVYARSSGFAPFKRVALADTIEMPELGFTATLADIYAGTPALEV